MQIFVYPMYIRAFREDRRSKRDGCFSTCYERFWCFLGKDGLVVVVGV